MSFSGAISRFRRTDLGRKNVTYISTSNSLIFHYPCVSTTECAPYEVIFSPGTYNIELWGAQGGDARFQNTEDLRPDSGGKGAYVSGIIHFIGTTKLYLYIGGKGQDQIAIDQTVSLGGFNGGGNGGVDPVDTKQPESGAGGGGATDLRFYLGDSTNAL